MEIMTQRDVDWANVTEAGGRIRHGLLEAVGASICQVVALRLWETNSCALLPDFRPENTNRGVCKERYASPRLMQCT